MTSTSKSLCAVPIVAIVPNLMAVAIGSVGCGADDEPTAIVGELCAEESRAEPFVTPLSKRTANGLALVTLVESVPSPPKKGDVTWTLRVTDVDGAPFASPRVRLRVWMPDHGHGAMPPEINAEALTPDGVFRAGPFRLQMPGYWEWTVFVEPQDGPSDQAQYAFCVEG